MILKRFALVVAVASAIAGAASAATVRNFNITLTEDTISGPARQWFGSLSVECASTAITCDGSVRKFTALIDLGLGLLNFNRITNPGPSTPGLSASFSAAGLPSLIGVVFPDLPPEIPLVNALRFDNAATPNGWAITLCSTVNYACGGEFLTGSYSVTSAEVPLPATLPLVLSGFAALAALRRRRRAHLI